MKKVFSLFLALMLVVSLFSAVGVSALADEEETQTGVTLLVTGGVGDAIGGDGLNYALVAGLKAAYGEDSVLLVDAGGFDETAVSLMNAVGYDLAVPAAQLEEAEFACVSMGVEELNAGGSFKRNDQTVAFIGIAEMGEQDAAEYYQAIQNNVDAAAAAGVDCIILMGAVEDAQALAENVSGVTMIITVGEESDETVLTLGETDQAAEEAEQTEEGEEAAEDAAEETAEEAVEEETQEPASVLLVTVGASFEGVAVITIDETGVVAGHVDAQALADKGVTADEDIAALEAVWLANAASEEEETEEPADDEGEETEEPEEEPVEAEESEEEQVEEPAAVDEPEADETAEPETTPADEPAAVNEEEADGQDEDSQGESDGTPSDAQEAVVSASDAEPVEDQSSDPDSEEDPEATTLPEETPDTTKKVTFEKGGADVVIALEHPIASVSANGVEQTKDSGYTLSDDNKTATISGSMLNGWGNGNYYFTFTFSDGAADETVIVTISGIAPEATATPEPTAEPTATPVPTAEPTATPVPNKGANPNTGDTSPIVLYVVILVVMVAALVVVIVLVVRKNKRR